jgi:hypothetical protein
VLVVLPGLATVAFVADAVRRRTRAVTAATIRRKERLQEPAARR